MIYQHRIVIARNGKLEKRHAAFQANALDALDSAGSVLVGAWEIWVGQEAGSAVWQLRQFDSMAAWAEHQDRVRASSSFTESTNRNLYPHLDAVNTSILRLSEISPPLPQTWPRIDDVRGRERGYLEQRIMTFRPGTTAEHHAFYKRRLLPALEIEGSTLVGLFDTLIGDGTTNSQSLRSVELRRFRDMRAWQRWHETQESDPELSKLVNREWLPHVAQMQSDLMRPLDYSRIR
ncbi:MAG: NIPSNAP family protein [Hyphomicrobiaceae bacterium]